MKNVLLVHWYHINFEGFYTMTGFRDRITKMQEGKLDVTKIGNYAPDVGA